MTVGTGGGRGSAAPSPSDAAVADALACSLADIAGGAAPRGSPGPKHAPRWRRANGSSNGGDTTAGPAAADRSSHSSSNSDREPGAGSAAAAVTGSTTTNSDSNGRDEAFTAAARSSSASSLATAAGAAEWPGAAAHPRHRGSGGGFRRRWARERGDSDSSGSAEEAEDSSEQDGAASVLPPSHAPQAATRTVHRGLATRRQDSSSSNDDEKTGEEPRRGSKRKTGGHVAANESAGMASQRMSGSGTDNGSSSGSGTEGGYAGSASADGDNAGSSSPSISSSDDSLHKKKNLKRHTVAKKASESTNDPKRPMLLAAKQESSLSSEIADFGSSSSDNGLAGSFADAFAPSPNSSRSPSVSSDSQDDTLDSGDRALTTGSWPKVPLQVSNAYTTSLASSGLRTEASRRLDGKAQFLSIDCDIMAHVLTFLEPPNILNVLTMPLCKGWLLNFTRQSELWRVLCLLEPFKAHVDNNGDDSSDESANIETELRSTFGKHRLLYTSFVRCMRYLTRIKDDADHGRPPSMIDYGSGPATFKNIEANRNLNEFLARARGITVFDGSSDISDEDNTEVLTRRKSSRRPPKPARNIQHHVNISDDGSDQSASRKRRRNETEKRKSKKKSKKVTYGHSLLTQRILGPTADGTAGTAVELPWSCAIYSIVNWMVAFSDVEGIQTMCMRVLPSLLDDEQQRITAQRAGLTDIIFRAMVMFPDSSDLHTASFHTVVLLARPLGGREGMLFHTSMVNSSGIFSIENGGESGSRNGIAVLLDSMRRFRDNEALQAMSCWSLVNVALAPAQKEMLVRLGAIEVTAAAMQTHPFNAEVQFRALFALVNLVIPSVSLNQDESNEQRDNLHPEDSSEKEILDENVGMIVELVVQSMKNFCASEAILNRACLVLHNLSLTDDYHTHLLWTPNCYQMLEWCLANYPSDQVLQQSAAGTLHRLQVTLSGDEALRTRFMASLQSQQQLSLEQAHREAGALHRQVSTALR